MQGLTAKVFRTYNASFTMSNLLRDMKSTGTIPEKVKDYNDANRRVAILCNHKRTVTAGHAGQMEKLEDKIKGLIYQRWRLKQMLLDIDTKQKRKKGAEYFELDSELDKEWIKEHQQALVEEQRQKIEKKFGKENEKLAAEGKKEMKKKELEERLEAADELAAKFKKENKSGKVEAEGKGPSIDKIEANIEKVDTRIANMKLQAEDKESNKEVALGTSKIVSPSEWSVALASGANLCRITLTPASPSSSPRSLGFPSRSSSPRRSARSLIGRSSRSTRTGSSRWSRWLEACILGRLMSGAQACERCSPGCVFRKHRNLHKLENFGHLHHRAVVIGCEWGLGARERALMAGSVWTSPLDRQLNRAITWA